MPSQTSFRFTSRAGVIALASVAALAAGVALWQSDAFATPPPSGSAPAPAGADQNKPAAAPAANAPAGGATADQQGKPATAEAAAEPAGPPRDPNKVQIVFQTVPPAYASVFWGRKRIGRIKPRQPLVIERPRDSGPLDVMIRAGGFLPVQTRAHTFADNKLMVKLTREEDKSTLFGYREPLDAGIPGPDGGVPETLSEMPPSLGSPATPAVTPLLQSQPAPLKLQPQAPLQPQPQAQPKPQ